MKLLLLVLSLSFVVIANPCNLGAAAVERQIVAANGDDSGILKYVWSGNTLTFCAIANQDFCIEEASVWLSSTSTFSNSPTVFSYGCTSDSQKSITTAANDAYFRIIFKIKKFTDEFPIGIVAESYVLQYPSDWHDPQTQKSKSYFGSQTLFVAGATTYHLFANCVDKFTSISPGVTYNPKFYHYLDPNVPDVYKPNFYKINYLINADIKETLLSMHPEGWSQMDIQYAIWDMVHPFSNIYGSTSTGGGFNLQRSLDFRQYAEGAPLNWAAGPGDYDSLVAFVDGRQDTMVHVPYDLLVAYVEDNLPTDIPKYYTISGVVEGDCESPCNGARNPVFSVLPGLSVELLQNGVVIDTTTSASDGTFTFEVQQPNVYEVRLGSLTSAYTSCLVTQVVSPPPDLGTASYPTYVRLSAFPISSDSNGNSIGDACEPKVSGSIRETCADTCNTTSYQNN